MPKYPGVYKKVYPSGKVVYYGAKWHRGKTYTTSVHPTAQGASEALQELTRQLSLNITPDKGKITVSQFVKLYLEKYISTGHVDIVTKYKHESSLRNQMIPRLGHLQLRDIDGETVQDYQNALLVNYKPSTVKVAMADLKRLMHRAILWGYITQNPTLGIDSISVVYRKPTILEPQQILGIMYDLQIPLRERCIIGILGFTGMRISECFGLMKEKIQFNENIIRIDFRFYQGVVKPIRASSKGKPRTVPILPDLEPVLKEWYLMVGGGKWLFPGG